jgi:hypothetical protein
MDHRLLCRRRGESDFSGAVPPLGCNTDGSSPPQPRSGGRVQPTAQAVGRDTQRSQAPEGRKTMPHTSGNILLHFIFSTAGRRPLIKPEFRDDLFAYLGGIVREMKWDRIDHQWRTGSRPHVDSSPGGGDCTRGEGQFVTLGAGEAFGAIWMADRVWSFQRQRVERCGGDRIHRGTAGAS